ncbi:MAG TPA: hypothetical protein VMI06_02780 [Terriglobia bacterium]|nr:hypothetical protein [Terriglobia bacterium]
MTDDSAILRQLSAEMKRIILAACRPGERAETPPTLEDGRAVHALLDLYFGNAGYVDTERAIGVEEPVIHFYQDNFREACANLGLTEADVRELFERLRQ